MRNTPNPGRPVDPRQATPLPSEADIEIGRATPGATVAGGGPARRWREATGVEAEEREAGQDKAGQ